MHQIAKAILPGELMFDIGANQGDKTAWFADRQMRVVAVEPQPAMVAKLIERFGGNPMVSIVPKGLGAAQGNLKMSINTAEPVLSTFSEEWKVGRFQNSIWDERVDVAITTLDRLVAQHGIPRYTKIDVEGFERNVLAGLTRKIGIISFEYCAEFLVDAADCCDRLTDIGYGYFNISLGESDDFYFEKWVSAKDAIATLKAISDAGNPLLWGDIYAV